MVTKSDHTALLLHHGETPPRKQQKASLYGHDFLRSHAAEAQYNDSGKNRITLTKMVHTSPRTYIFRYTSTTRPVLSMLFTGFYTRTL